MRHELAVYLDFDKTLFDTPRFSADLQRLIANAAGLPNEQVASDSSQFRTHARLGGYSFEAHLRAYGLDPEIMWQQLHALTHTNDYLYPDASHFVQSLRAEGFDPQILSFGERRFQEAKIMPTLPRLAGELGARALSYTVVYEPKNGYLASLHSGEQGVLVDDIPSQQLPAGFYEVHLDHGRDSGTPYARTADGFVVANLSQARDAIRELAAGSRAA